MPIKIRLALLIGCVLAFAPYALPADIYGGNPAIAGTVTGYWHPQKVGTQWWVITPLGNGMRLLAPYLIGRPNDTAALYAKYSADSSTWSCYYLPAVVNRLHTWGFNALGIGSDAALYPYTSNPDCWSYDSSLGGYYPPVQYRLPVLLTPTISINAMLGRTWSAHPHTLTQPIKNWDFGINPIVGYGGYLPVTGEADLGDPAFYDYAAYILRWHGSMTPHWNAPSDLQKYTAGVYIDEADQLFSFTTGGVDADPAITFNHSHGGLRALRASPLSFADHKKHAIYPDGTVFTKAVTIRNYLKNKYGTIAALNAAWGSSYAACDMEGRGDEFGSCGVSYTAESYGTGDGVSSTYTHTLAHLAPSPHSIAVYIGGVLMAGDVGYNAWEAMDLIGSSFTSITVSANVATAHFANNSNVFYTAGSAVAVNGALVSALNGRYLIATASSSGFTIQTSGVADGTYNNPALRVSGVPYAAHAFPPGPTSHLYGPLLDYPSASIDYTTGEMSVTIKAGSVPIASVSGTGSVVTVRTGSDSLDNPNQHGTWPGAHVTITGTTNYNITNAVVASVVDSYTFTISNAATGPTETAGTASFPDTYVPSGTAITVSYVVGGYTSGNGLMDEDGRHSSCLGSDDNGDNAIDLNKCDGSLVAPSANVATSQVLGAIVQGDAGAEEGIRFTIGSQDIVATALCRWRSAGNTHGLFETLWNATTGLQIPGGQVTQDSGAGDADTWHCVSLSSPVTLTAGGQYRLTTTEFSDENHYGNGTSLSTVSALTVTGGVSSSGGWHNLTDPQVPTSFMYQTGPAVPDYNTLALKTDLEGVLGAMASAYFSGMDTAYTSLFGPKGAGRTVPNLGPDPLIYWTSPSAAGVLAAAGTYLDAIGIQSYQSGAEMNQTKLDYIRSHAGDVPLINVDFIIANPDSSQSLYAGEQGFDNGYTTQEARGTGYYNHTSVLTGLAYSNGGSHPYLGSGFWAWSDFVSTHTNFGLVTPTDNAYDGVEPQISSSACSPSTPAVCGVAHNQTCTCGGEAGDYGDFMTSVVSANARWQTPISIVGGGSKHGGHGKGGGKSIQ